MNNDETKPRLHIHTGGLVILIIIMFILFKVDIKEKINSPQFQKNITYIENTAKNIWDKYIGKTLKNGAKNLFINYTNQGFTEIQNSVTENLFDKKTEE